MTTSTGPDQELPEPAFEVVGDQYIWTWDGPVPLRFRCDQLRETPAGLWAELWVESAQLIGVNGTARRAHYHYARLNLASTSGREAIVKALHRADDRLARLWPKMLEYVCATATATWRQGNAVIDVSERPEPGDVAYLIAPCLPLNETTLFSADGDSGKSWLAAILAVAVASGQRLPSGLRVTQRTGVLYLDYETGEDEVTRRLYYAARGFGLATPPRIYYRWMERALADDVDRIRAIIHDHQIGFVIVDSLGPAAGGPLKEDEPAIRLMTALRRLRGVTRLGLAHVSKETADKKEGRGRTYGSVFFENLARSIFEIRTDEIKATQDCTETALVLLHTKVNLGRRQLPIGLRLAIDDVGKSASLHVHAVSESPEILQRMSLRRRLLSALRDGAKDTATLADLSGAKENAVRAELSRMLKRDEVVQIGGESPAGGSRSLWGLRTEDDQRF